MDMSDFESMLQALPLLSSSELGALADRCAALRALGGKTATARSAVPQAQAEFVMTLYGALCDELQSRTGASSMPYPVFERQPAFAKFAPAALEAAKANRAWFPEQSKAQRLSMCRMYATLLLDHIEGAELPSVWNTISWALAELPAVVDGAFPGYARAGMLGTVQELRTRPLALVE